MTGASVGAMDFDGMVQAVRVRPNRPNCLGPNGSLRARAHTVRRPPVPALPSLMGPAFSQSPSKSVGKPNTRWTSGRFQVLTRPPVLLSARRRGYKVSRWSMPLPVLSCRFFICPSPLKQPTTKLPLNHSRPEHNPRPQTRT
jgi:hypothetical protein